MTGNAADAAGTVRQDLVNKALLISLLDTEVNYLPGDEAEPVEDYAKRWSQELLKKRREGLEKRCPAYKLSERSIGSLISLLSGETNPAQWLLGQTLPYVASLQRFLHIALDQAIILSLPCPEKKKPAALNWESQSAGSIYLYNDQHDELIMAASSGFPFTSANIPFIKSKDILSPDEETDFGRNFGKLLYIRTVLARMAFSNIPRHPWLRHELTDTSLWFGRRGQDDVDCNRELIGVAYYKPKQGITGQLFDKDEGPKLEREALDNLKIPDRLKCLLPERHPLLDHFDKTVLNKCTIVFKRRADMASGRQVQAGTYEGLQFPTSRFIGPFLGTVLRFCGEHFGIMKVERHKFFQPGESNTLTDEQILEVMTLLNNDDKIGFETTEACDFLLFSYVLSGLLYILKHHAGVDLRQSWNTCLSQTGEVSQRG